MKSKITKVLIFSSAIALLAAGCNSSQAQGTANQNTPAPTGMQSQLMPTPVNSSSTMPGIPANGNASSTRGRSGMINIPAGSKPFFGTISSVSGSQITISGHSRNSSSTVSTIINVTSSTQFTGGSQSSLTTGTRIAGIGTTNNDSSLNATSLQVNPTFQGRGSGSGRYNETQQSSQ